MAAVESQFPFPSAVGETVYPAGVRLLPLFLKVLPAVGSLASRDFGDDTVASFMKYAASIELPSLHTSIEQG